MHFRIVWISASILVLLLVFACVCLLLLVVASVFACCCLRLPLFALVFRLILLAFVFASLRLRVLLCSFAFVFVSRNKGELKTKKAQTNANMRNNAQEQEITYMI